MLIVKKYIIFPESTELDEWLMSNYLLYFDENDYLNQDLYKLLSLALIQIRFLDKKILGNENIKEWKGFRSAIMIHLDRMSCTYIGFKANEGRLIINMLRKIRQNSIYSNTNKKLLELLEDDINKLDNLMPEDLISIDDEFDEMVLLPKLQKETIEELMKISEEFHRKISSELFNNLNLHLLSKIIWLIR